MTIGHVTCHLLLQARRRQVRLPVRRCHIRRQVCRQACRDATIKLRVASLTLFLAAVGRRCNTDAPAIVILLKSHVVQSNSTHRWRWLWLLLGR